MLLKQFSVAFIPFIILLLWKYSYQLSCLALIIPFTLAIILSKVSYDYSSAKKKCFADCYFSKDSLPHRFLTKKYLVVISSSFVGVVLASILLLNILTYSMIDFVLLFIDMLFIVWLYYFLAKSKSLQMNVKYPILKNSVSFLSSIVFMFIFLLLNLYQEPPSYIENDLLQTIHIASNQVQSSCAFIDWISRVSNEVVAIKWWMMLKVSIEISNIYFKYMMWILYLLGNYLMLFAFARLITESMHLLVGKNDAD